MDEYKEKLVRKLKFKCREAEAELKEVRAIYNLAVGPFVVSIESFCADNGLANPLDSLEAPEKEKRPLDSSFKKVFIDIVSTTHPDKTQNTDSVEFYQKAVEAKKNHKLTQLVAVAHDLKINLSELSYSSIRDLESHLNETCEEISNIRSTYPWRWHYSEPSSRKKIIERFVHSLEV